MKKLFIYSISILIFLACEKKNPEPVKKTPITTELSNGLGDEHSSINGYIYSGATKSIYNNTTNYYLNYYAAFSDPENNLLLTYNHNNETQSFNNNIQANISVGNINISNAFIGPNILSNSVSYHYSYSLPSETNYNFPTNVSIEGNGTFMPFNLNLNRDYPKILYAPTSLTITTSKGFSIDISSFMSNYDSACVKIQTSSFVDLKKTIDGNQKIISFSADELKNVFYYSTFVTIMGFNYSNKTIEDKKYIFELANKISITAYINP